MGEPHADVHTLLDQVDYPVEQEQLDALKAFWNKHGNWITWVQMARWGSKTPQWQVSGDAFRT